MNLLDIDQCSAVRQTFLLSDIELPVCVCVMMCVSGSAPHELSLWNKTPDLLHANNVADEFLQSQETLQAGVHVAALSNVGKPEVTTGRTRNKKKQTTKTQKLAGLRWCLVWPWC